MSSGGAYGRQGYQSNPSGYGAGGGYGAPTGGGYMAPQYGAGAGYGGGASYSAPTSQGSSYGSDYGAYSSQGPNVSEL